MHGGVGARGAAGGWAPALALGLAGVAQPFAASSRYRLENRVGTN
ncbi:hypothetical protein SCATT_06110 [Streptantibioticus cattleyicolor NRRL 8057 = DSM 46488]|uniref:Uncharacterized protein n=1 Tax=Streptantibioticus cattleyicolor (strain ATCC 35852 / DSM 46488 / JCM 4925 / NBRC 14057 / NRRL 8057) TaxID=1003195 RepID=G8WT99_STREN|nr:hypothetical protein SCATT_06110 [Streptantibioticus cattleyicolor NRRL 8057 = DSM 46488]